jgi:hypothetical protein
MTIPVEVVFCTSITGTSGLTYEVAPIWRIISLLGIVFSVGFGRIQLRARRVIKNIRRKFKRRVFII